MNKITLIMSALVLIANYLLPTFSFAQYTQFLDFESSTTGKNPNGNLVSDGTCL